LLDGIEGDKCRAIGQVGEPVLDYRDRQPSLPRATRTEDRDEPMIGEQRTDALDVALAADQARERAREALGSEIDGAKARKVARQALDQQLVEVLRTVEILEVMRAEVRQAQARRQLTFHQDPSLIGDDHLSTV